YVVLRSREHWTVSAGAGVTLLAFQWLLLDSYARTGILGYVIVLMGAVVLGRGRNRRRVLLLGAAFFVLALIHARISVSKPILAAPQSLGNSGVGAVVPPEVLRTETQPILS